MKEQFIEVLPEEAKVWVKEHKPETSEKAGSLAEDFRQARKKELWQPTRSTKRCNCCGRLGHLAKTATIDRMRRMMKRKMNPIMERTGMVKDLLHIAPSAKRRDILQHNVARKLYFAKQETRIVTGELTWRSVDSYAEERLKEKP